MSGSNPLSTQDDVAAALAELRVVTFAWHGTTPEEYKQHLNPVLDTEPELIIEDGGDLIGIGLLHSSRAEVKVLGGCEETTTGVKRLRALEQEGKLRFPIC